MSDLEIIPVLDQTVETSRPVTPSSLFQAFSISKLRQFGLSSVDQALSVGGMFLANIVLARSQSKEEYGMFALSYSVYTFLVGFQNAAILEPYTIHGPGRFHQRFSEYSRLMSRNNAVIGCVLTALVFLVWGIGRGRDPALSSRSFLGLACALFVLLTAAFVRRTFYLRRRPDLAAKFSVVFFLTLVPLLLVSAKFGFLNGLSVYLLVAISWMVAGIFIHRELPGMSAGRSFHEQEPNYWSEHWKYSRWVLATALVFQFTTQGYYWLLAGFLSLKEVGALRAMYILVGPSEQIVVALDLLVLPIMAFRYASSQHGELVSLWKMFGLMNIAITSAYAIAIWILAKPLMHSVYAGKFDDISVLLGTLALLPVVAGVGNSVNVALKSIEKPDMVLYAYLAGGATTFCFGIPLVAHFGLRGAVYGMLTSAAAYTITMFIGLLASIRSKLPGMRIFSPTQV